MHVPEELQERGQLIPLCQPQTESSPIVYPVDRPEKNGSPWFSEDRPEKNEPAHHGSGGNATEANGSARQQESTGAKVRPYITRKGTGLPVLLTPPEIARHALHKKTKLFANTLRSSRVF